MADEPLFVGIGSRGRVERLMRGEARHDDLRELFFGMRDENGIISEIGHFLAHPGIRTKGIVWREVTDQLALTKIMESVRRSRIIQSDVPASLPPAMYANLRRIRTTDLNEKTGKTRAQATKILKRIFARTVPTGPNRISKPSPKSQEEIDVFICVGTIIKVEPLFSDSDLFDDFCKALQKQGLLQAAEKSSLDRSKVAITLFALIAMHNRKIDLGDGSTARLAIAPDPKNRLGIYSIADVVKDYGAGATTFATWLVETSLPVPGHCEKGVAAPERHPFTGDLEVNAAGKIQRVV
jgi:hypothetical protein